MNSNSAHHIQYSSNSSTEQQIWVHAFPILLVLYHTSLTTYVFSEEGRGDSSAGSSRSILRFQQNPIVLQASHHGTIEPGCRFCNHPALSPPACGTLPHVFRKRTQFVNISRGIAVIRLIHMLHQELSYLSYP